MMSNANSDLIAKILTEDLLSEDSSESEYEPSVDEEEDFLEQEEDVSESSEEEADSSDGEEPEQSQGVFISKNSQETWSKEPQRAPQGRQPALNVMNRSPGPTRHALREVDTIESSFRLFMKNSLLREIIHWSNKEGRLTYGEDWKAMDETELSCFLGLLILAGVFKAHHEAITELWNKEDGRAIFSASMARSRFQQITRILRFDNAESRRRQAVQEDKLQPIRSFFESWVSGLQDCYMPHENVTVDEQLMVFRGRCPFRQYIPSKPGRYGIKIWTLCDSKTTYVYNMQVYTGRSEGQTKEKNQGERVVMDLIRGLEKSGRNVTTDNFFTSLSLARKLKSMNLTLLGTIRKNKGELPNELVATKKREKFSSIFAFQDQETLVSYCPKKGKVVLLLSTMHFQPEVSEATDKKPLMILDYNATKAGVDTMDQMVRNYTTKRKTRRWPMALFYNMVDVSALNAFIIWMHLKPDWNESSDHRRRRFLLELGKSLIQANQERRVQMPPPLPQKAQKRGRCSYCARSNDLKQSTFCSVCAKFVCNEHSRVVCYVCMQP